jgi:hypothetical protein
MGITKDEILRDKDFDMLQEYLESMYPDRYEFKEHELLIHYPEVTIKNLNGQTYNIYNVFIDYGYNNNSFGFTKLHYSVSDYMNQTGNAFTHSHISKGTIAHKTYGYCYGKLNIEYRFTNLQNLIAVINTVDFWLHNENSSDCYTPIASVFHSNGEDSLTSVYFKTDIVEDLNEGLIKNVDIKKTIFGDIVDITWNDEVILRIMEDYVLDKRLNCAIGLRNILDAYQTTTINFKDKDYYISIEGFSGETLKSITKTNINENVVRQLKQMADGITKNPSFLSNIEQYYINN